MITNAARKPHETPRPAIAFPEAKSAVAAKAMIVFVVDGIASEVAARIEIVKDGLLSGHAKALVKKARSALLAEWAVITDTKMSVASGNAMNMTPRIDGAISTRRVRMETTNAETVSTEGERSPGSKKAQRPLMLRIVCQTANALRRPRVGAPMTTMKALDNLATTNEEMTVLNGDGETRIATSAPMKKTLSGTKSPQRRRKWDIPRQTSRNSCKE